MQIIEQLNLLSGKYPKNFFNNKLSDTDLELLLSNNNITNDEIGILYNWNNGIVFDYENQNQNTQFASFGYLIPIAEALSIYYEEEFLGFKAEKLLPIVADYSGHYLLISIEKRNLPIYI